MADFVRPEPQTPQTHTQTPGRGGPTLWSPPSGPHPSGPSLVWTGPPSPRLWPNRLWPSLFDRLWPNLLWPKKNDRLWPTLFDRLWPNRLWPKLMVQFFWPSFSKKNKSSWAPNPRKMGPKGWAPKGGEGPNISLLFFTLPLPFSLFFCLSGCLLVDFWWCLKWWGLQMCTFEVLGLSCEASAAFPGSPNQQQPQPQQHQHRQKWSGAQTENKCGPKRSGEEGEGWGSELWAPKGLASLSPGLRVWVCGGWGPGLLPVFGWGLGFLGLEIWPKH